MGIAFLGAAGLHAGLGCVAAVATAWAAHVQGLSVAARRGVDGG